MRLDQLITDDQEPTTASEQRGSQLSMSRRALEVEVFPSLEEGVTSLQTARELCAQTKGAIRVAFSRQNSFYQRLARYNHAGQEDAQFAADLMSHLDAWLHDTEDTLKNAEGPLPKAAGGELVELPDLFDIEDVEL